MDSRHVSLSYGIMLYHFFNYLLEWQIVIGVTWFPLGNYFYNALIINHNKFHKRTIYYKIKKERKKLCHFIFIRPVKWFPRYAGKRCPCKDIWFWAKFRKRNCCLLRARDGKTSLSLRALSVVSSHSLVRLVYLFSIFYVDISGFSSDFKLQHQS